MEIGSFIEMQFLKGREFYKGSENIARLNSGRTAIWHAFRVLECNAIWLPYYLCDTVRDFLRKKNAVIKYYHIDELFNPINLKPMHNEAVLLVNYYGIMSYKHMSQLAANYKNVIIDNSQAFFAEPLTGCMNVYSARKFVGVPDGSYVIGNKAEKYLDEYEQCCSSDTAAFLLQRIEYGCEGKTYESRMVNEHRIDSEDIMKMSRLTHTILDGTYYEEIKEKRRHNFQYAHSLLGEYNLINPIVYYDESCAPMIYPLVVEDNELLGKLLKAKHFQGHWWTYLLDELDPSSFEYWISKYIIPITIDQRYEFKDIKSIKDLIINH